MVLSTFSFRPMRQGIVLKKSLAFSTPILLEGRRRNTQWREFLSVYSAA